MSSLYSSLMRTIGGRVAAGALPLGIAFSLAACGPTSYSASSSAPAPASQTASPSGSATHSGGSSSGGGSAPTAAASPSSPVSSSGTGSVGFSKALAAWKAASRANAATMGLYFQRAATDLKESGNPGYRAAISELEYLISLPDTDVPPAQQAQARADLKNLNTFFGTPGLIS